MNLITNSVDSVSDKGKISLTSYQTTQDNLVTVYWSIEDDGQGISEENKSKIFEDFYTNKKHGTGLGLSVCKMLLDEHEADITFESEVGKGTKFIIRFKPIDMSLHE